MLVETDTVTGASPYIFNCSMRSVYGMQGLHADGAKATGFRSMVTAQFTAVSLQKDDRAFVKYDKTNRRYSGIAFSKQTGALLSSESSSTNPNTVFHLDQEANYRKGFRTTHIKVSNDAVVQIVSVFAIGFHAHFEMINGADASITNSNSNFGTFSLLAEGFKKEAFAKDNKGFITSVITPRSVVSSEQQIEYLQIDVSETTSTKLFLFAQSTLTLPPAGISQGFRIGARLDEKIYVDNGGSTFSASVVMPNGASGTTNVGEKNYEALHSDASASTKSVFTINAGHELSNGESIRVIADNGDLPENLDPHTVYFAITSSQDSALGANQIRIASSKTNADLAVPVFVKTVASNVTDKFRIVSRVSDKNPNDAGHPIQYDASAGQWFIHTLAAGNTIHNGSSIYANATDDDITYVLRKDDDRSLDEKIYKLRYVIPKELTNGRDPIDGFVIQDSSSTNVLANSDYSKTSLTANDYGFDRNTRFISQASFDGTEQLAKIRSDKPHNLNVGDQIVVRNVQSSTNSTALDGKGYNGTFIVAEITNDKEFRYSPTDTSGVTHTTGTFTNNTQTRSTLLPRFDRNDNSGNFFVYRTETITPYIQGVQDGVFHLFVLNSNNAMDEPSNEFSENKYNQNIVNLFPEYDRDNVDANPPEAVSYAKRFPIGDVVTNDLKKSVTRETTNQFLKNFDGSIGITSVTNNSTNAVINLDEEHGLQSVKYHNTLNGGSGHTDGTYYNVRLLNSNATPATAPWDGATAKVVVSSGAVTSVEITEGGSGYTNGETLFFDAQSVALGGIGGSPSASITIATAGISSATGNYIQVTGITTGTDSYHRISSVNGTKQITVAKSAADTLLDGQQIHDMGPWVAVGSASTTSGVTQFTTPVDHGLSVGNKFRVLNSSDATLGDFIVTSVVGITQFSAKTTSSLTDAKYILKHGLSDNESISGAAGENIDVRGFNIFDHETLILNEAIGTGDGEFKVKLPDGTTTATSIVNRFPLGSYIQIGSEIMRIASSSLSGSGGDEISVIRGSLGTNTDTHLINSRIKKVKPLPVELRRPSILRSSGHTFEYVGFGPGNYSTALPQLQNRSLTEREEFLNQAQETSCGNVVYTGMNDKGDFYIGNTKIESASGQQKTFDIPVATVTGEDPNRLSLVADEVVVKERLLVEGGASKQILSQFDGPVTFNSDLRLSDDTKQLITEASLRAQDAKFRDTTNSTAPTNGSVVIDGGLGLAKDLQIGGNIVGDTASTLSGFNSITATSFSGDGSGLTNTGAQLTTATSGSERIVLTNLTSGTMITAKTDGDLTFNFATNTLAVPNISVSGGLSGNADTATLATNVVGAANRVIFNNNTNTTTTSAALTFDGTTLNVTNNIRANNIRLGSASGTTIDTTSGDLVLDSSNNKVDIQANVDINNSLQVKGNTNASSKDTGALIITAGGLGVEGNIHAGGDLVAFSSSDVTLKKDISPIENALEMINKISGNTFTWNVGMTDLAPFENGTKDTGILAQEVEALGLPGVTTTRGDGVKAVRYDRLIPVLIEAVKELTAKVKSLESNK